MSDHIVIGDRVLLDASFRAVRVRLEMLAGDGMLAWASEVAYGEGIAGLGQAIVRRCATAVIGSFLDSVACKLVHPAGMAGLLAGGVGRAPAGFTGLAHQVRLLLAGSGALRQARRAVGLKAGALVGWEAMWLLAPSRAR